MKRYITILFLFLGLIQAQAQRRAYEYDDLNRLSKVVSSPTTPTQTIAINSPTGGTFTAGQSVSVSYASTNGSGNVSLELVSCSGTTALLVISADAAASGRIAYTLPSNLTAGSYRIKSYITGTPE